MKRFEDIVKDKLETFEETLPETDLADFMARLDESRSSTVPGPARKNRRSIWNIATPAVAASLLAVFVLTRPQGTDDSIAHQEPIAVSESVAIIEEPEPEGLLAQADIAINETSESDSIVDPITDETAAEAAPFFDSDNESGEADNGQQDSSASIGSPAIFDPVEPNFTGEYSDNKIYFKNVTRAAGAIGTVSLATIMSSVGGFLGKAYDAGEIGQPSDDPAYGENSGQQYPNYIPNYPDDFIPGKPWPRMVKDYLPLTIGASLRWEFADRLSLTTGMDFNRYKSVYKFKGRTFDLNRTSIGIPVRVDYSFVQNKLLDLYIGAGGSAEYFVSIAVDGKKSGEDGLLISAQAASGLQINISKHVGAYVEPQLIWVLPSVLYDNDPFRRDHPLFLKLATGIRFTI